MAVPLRVLFLEDNPADVELVRHALQKAGFEVDGPHVDDEESFLAHLNDDLDIILADYALSQFDARRALQMVRERGLDVPFLVVSGTIGEDLAVEMIKLGAADYLLKDRLGRLGTAVQQALEQRRMRKEHLAIEEAMRSQDRLLRAVVEHASDGIALLRKDMTIAYLSPAAERLAEYAPSEVSGSNVLDFIHPDDRQKAVEAFAEAMEKPGHSRRVDVRARRKDGSWRWIECTANNLLDEPAVQALVVNYRDIEDRKRAEQALRESEGRYRLLFDRNPQPMWVYDRQSLVILAVNFAAIESYGYSSSEFLKMSILDLHPPEVHSGLIEAVHSLPGRIRRPGVWPQIRRDGSRLTAEIVTHDLAFDGRSARLVMALDVTEREGARQALETSERRYRELTDEAPIGIYRTAPDGRILFVNPPLAKMLGYDNPDEILARSLEAGPFEASYERADFKARLEIEGEIRGLEASWTRKDGSRLFIRENARLVRSHDGNGVYYEGTVEDITERKKAEDESRRRSEEVVELYEAGRALGQTLDLETLFDNAYQAIARVMDCSEFYISTFDPATETIRCAYARHDETKLDATDFPAIPLEADGEGTQSRVIRSGESLYLPDYRADRRTARTRSVADREGVLPDTPSDDSDVSNSGVLVPLKLEGRVTGVLQVFSQRMNAYREDQIRFLEALAPQLAAAMANARLFRRAQQEIGERKQAEAAMRRLSEFNEGIIRNMTEGIVLETTGEVFSFVNPAAASMLGYQVDELVGQHLSSIIPADQVAVVRTANERRTQGESDRYELQLMRKDGTRIPVLVSGSPRMEDDHYAGTIAVFTDITELKTAQASLTRRATELEALYQTSLQINAQPDLRSMLQTIVERAVTLLGVHAGDIYLLGRDGDLLELTAGVGVPDKSPGRKLHKGEGISGLVFERGETVAIEDYRSWPGRAHAFRDAPFRRCLGVPLKIGSRTLGVLNLADTVRPGTFSPEDIRLVELFADQAAIAVENARLLEAERGRARDLEALYEISLQINAQTDLAKLLDTVVEQARGLVRVDAGALALLQPDGETLKFVVAQGFGRRLIGSERRRGQGISGRVLECGQTMTVEDYAAWEGRSLGAEDSGRVVSVPLRVGGRTIGVLNLGDLRRKGTFEAESIRLAELVADQAAIAVENARLLEAERRRVSYLEGVTSVSTALRAAGDRSRMTAIIADELVRLLDTPHVGIVLRASEKEVVMEVGRGLAEAMVGVVGPADQGIAGHVLGASQPFVSDRASKDERILHRQVFRGTEHVIGVPLAVQDEGIGVIVAARSSAFEEEDIRLLTAVAEMAGNALHRAGVMQTLEQRVAGRTQDLEAANLRLQELDQLKSTFVSNVSHELRAPITNILLYLDLIEQPGKENRRPAYMGILRGEAARLRTLIEDLLTLSRLERGAVTLDLEPHVIDGLISQVVASQEAHAHLKHIVLRHEPNPDVPPLAVAHGPMVQVLTNLIGNAVSYSGPASTVTVTTRRESVRGEDYAAVRVHNNGPAIPEEDMPHLFERFFRGSAAVNSGEPGTGLGLSICKEIVERHHGWIDVDNAAEIGTAFTVWLPLTSPSDK